MKSRAAVKPLTLAWTALLGIGVAGPVLAQTSPAQ